MLLTKLLFPECAGLRVDRFWREAASIHLQVSRVRRWARCPVAGGGPSADTRSTSGRWPTCPVAATASSCTCASDGLAAGCAGVAARSSPNVCLIWPHRLLNALSV